MNIISVLREMSPWFGIVLRIGFVLVYWISWLTLMVANAMNVYSLVFIRPKKLSWPSIIQVAILLFMANVNGTMLTIAISLVTGIKEEQLVGFIDPTIIIMEVMVVSLMRLQVIGYPAKIQRLNKAVDWMLRKTYGFEESP